jgi:hypothetical protein
LKDAEVAAKAGDYEKALTTLTAESARKLATVGARASQQEISLAISTALPGIDATMAADILGAIAPRAAYDADTGAVVFKGPDGQTLVKDGKPLTASQIVAEHVAARPYLQPATVPTRTGGASNGRPAPIGTIPLSRAANLTIEESKAIVAGTLKFTEG